MWLDTGERGAKFEDCVPLTVMCPFSSSTFMIFLSFPQFHYNTSRCGFLLIYSA